jgi:hypothetical protein
MLCSLSSACGSSWHSRDEGLASWCLLSGYREMLSLGSSDIIGRQLTAIGGYLEIVPLGALIFLLPIELALSSRRRSTRWSRVAGSHEILL